MRCARLAMSLVAIVMSAAVTAACAGPRESSSSSSSAAGLAGFAHSVVTPGVDLYQGEVHVGGQEPTWVVTVQDGKRTVLSRSDAVSFAARLQTAALPVRIEPVDWPSGAAETGTIGWLVRVGAEKYEAAAKSLSDRVAAAGLAGKVEWTGFDQGVRSTARVSVLVMDRSNRSVGLAVTNGNTAAVPETVTDLEKRADGTRRHLVVSAILIDNLTPCLDMAEFSLSSRSDSATSTTHHDA
jgi:hypothetical protein